MSSRKVEMKPGIAWLFSIWFFCVSAVADTLPLREPIRDYLAWRQSLTLCVPRIHYPPYLFDHRGMVPDLSWQLAELLKVGLSTHTYPSWEKVKEAFNQGECDLVPVLGPEELEHETAAQSQPLLTVEPALLYLPQESNGPVLLQPAWYADELLQRILPGHPVRALTPGSSPIPLLQQGKGYAYLGDYLSERELLRQHPELDIHMRTLDRREWQMSLRMLVRPEPLLLEAVNSAIRYLPPANVYRVLDNYVPNATHAINQTKWSDDEQSWLARTRVLRVVANPGLQPFSGVSRTGQPTGWSMDVLQTLLKSHGIALEWLQGRDREESLKLVEQGEADLMLGLVESSDLSSRLRFTRIMAMSRWALLSARGSYHHLSDVDGEEVLVPASLWDPSLLAQLGNARWKQVPSIVDGAERLRRGEGVALLADLYQLQYPLRLNQLHDLSISDLVDERWGLAFAVSPHQPMLAKILDKAMMTVTPGQQDELRQRWLQISVTQVEGVSYGVWIGSSLGILLIGGTITLFIWRSRRMLADEVERRREVELGLSEARQRAEAAAEAKGRFLAAISHEIRTPMNAIIGLLEWLAGTPMATDQGRALERVRMATDELLGLLNDILDFTRNESSRLALTPQRVDLALLCEQVVAIHWPKALDKGLRLSVRITPELPTTLWLDPHRVSQILHNLLSNAIKFTAHGEVRLRVSRDEASLLLAVEDQGPGIDPALRPRLFLPFEQGLEARRQGQGTGLGLAICHQLVTLMGGDIGVSERAVGSCFWCRLPLREAEHPLPRRPVTSAVNLQLPEREAEQVRRWLQRLRISERVDGAVLTAIHDEQGAPAWQWGSVRLVPGSVLSALVERVDDEPLDQPAAAAGLRVLLVEDHDLNRRVLTMQLGQLGAEVCTAVDGVDALAKLSEGLSVDLVLTDLQMPRMDGAALCDEIKRDPRWQSLPVYVITADLSVQSAERLAACGCSGRLDKPVRRQELAALLHRQAPGEQNAVQPTSSEAASLASALLLDEATVTIYLQTHRQDLAKLAECWRCGDKAGWAAQLHRIKGSAKMVGSDKLVRLVELWQADPTWDGIGALEQAIDEETLRLRGES